MTEPCRCPLCRNPMRNLPHGSRTWHCSECGETMTEGYARKWAHVQDEIRYALRDGLAAHERCEVLRGALHAE